MLVEVKVPMLAESVADATLIEWHKKTGDVVKRGDSLIDIETDKVTLEVAAPNNGVLTEILKENGEDVISNEIIARIDTEGKARVETTPAIEPVEEETAQAIPEIKPETVPEQQNLPVLDEAQVVDEDSWNKEAEAELEETAEENFDEATEDPADIETEQQAVKLSPAVRNMIDNHDLDINNIQSQGNPERISKEDVLTHMGELEKPETPEASHDKVSTGTKSEHISTSTTFKVTPVEEKQATPQPATEVEKIEAEPEQEQSRPEQRVAMTRLRQRVAERLLNAQKENAILTTFNEVNMQPVLDLRARYQEEFQQAHGVKLGFMSFFCKAAVEALKKFPVINASVDGKDIVYYDYYDLGIAVSSPRGLVVPIVRDADLLSLSDTELLIRELGEKANQGTLELEELTGGTFTITNGGVFGSLLSTPILNPPQSAILGMHTIQQRPVAEDGQVVIRPMMYLALSYDHRIIDGREAVQFLVSIKEQLEDPARLLLQI